MTMHLSTIGGTTAKDIMGRLMRHILANELATSFNWVGRGNKSPFSTLRIISSIKAAAKKHGVTEAECECHIKQWLKHSSDRDGGRKNRQHKAVEAASFKRVISDTTDSD
ncbi:hypothetical protein SKAU_G00232150 [Synaphobranchus kaupii]|uniref:DUF4806 domain-containing protein n=1 Tax=Synaphobranchus kaupii TaxID=118154 RepID=A0A9Q1F5W6_SYNKA|nr:hypothetical protein SKAU_G00232150 [Synaphobranchus kaupii]